MRCRDFAASSSVIVCSSPRSRVRASRDTSRFEIPPLVSREMGAAASSSTRPRRDEITSATAACSLLWMSGWLIAAVLASIVAGSICHGWVRADSAAEVGSRVIASDWIFQTGCFSSRDPSPPEAPASVVGQARPRSRSRGRAASVRTGSKWGLSATGISGAVRAALARAMKTSRVSASRASMPRETPMREDAAAASAGIVGDSGWRRSRRVRTKDSNSASALWDSHWLKVIDIADQSIARGTMESRTGTGLSPRTVRKDAHCQPLESTRP